MLLDENAARHVLSATADLLEDMGLTYWIDSGTLLSAYRDRAFNVYDHDIDVRLLLDEVSDEPELVKRLWEAGYRSIANLQQRRAQILAGHPMGTGVLLDLKFCERDSEHLWYYCWREPDPTPCIHLYPVKFWDSLTTIKLYGRDYPCPSPIKDYIEFHYGKDWREFKVRVEDADETDLSWDYMKDPPCAYSLSDFIALKSSR